MYADLLAAKSPPDKAKLLAGGVRLRLRGGNGVDHVKVSRFNLARRDDASEQRRVYKELTYIYVCDWATPLSDMPPNTMSDRLLDGSQG